MICTIKFFGSELDQESFIQDFGNMVKAKKNKINKSRKYSPELKYLFCMDFDFTVRAVDTFFNTLDYKEAIRTAYIRDKNLCKLPPRTRASME